MICLDSDFLISLLRGDKSAKTKFTELENSNRVLVTTSVNILELYVGIVAVEGISSKRIEKTREFISNLHILPFDAGSAERSAYILNTLKNLGKPIGLKDSLIAGTALEHNTDILTRNIKHFERISGLKIETW